MSLGICCYLQKLYPFRSSTAPYSDLIHRIFVLPSLTSPTVDAFLLFSVSTDPSYAKQSGVKPTIQYHTYPMIFEHGNALTTSHSTPFITDEMTLSVGVYQNRYVQVTSKHVRCFTLDSEPIMWLLKDDASITCAFVGRRFVLIATNKKELICLSLDAQNPAYFSELDHKVMGSRITCVMEFLGMPVVGLLDRSLHYFEVEGQVLQEKTPMLLDLTPQTFASFANIRDSRFDRLVESHVFYVGCDDGDVYIIAWNPLDRQFQIITNTKIDNGGVSLSECVLNGVPAILMASNSTYRLVFKSDEYKFVPMFIQPDWTDEQSHAIVPSPPIQSMVVYSYAGGSSMFTWQRGNLIKVQLAPYTEDLSISGILLDATPRLLVPLSQGKTLVVGSDLNKSQPSLINSNVLLTTNSLGSFRSVQVENICGSSERITACCLLGASDTSDLLLFGFAGAASFCLVRSVLSFYNSAAAPLSSL